MKVAVIGLGKIGLPLAVQIAHKGIEVIGLDINELVVKQVNSGVEPFPGEENLNVLLKEVVNSGKLKATSDPEIALVEATHIVVIVPVLVDSKQQPDFKSIDLATENIGRFIKKGALVSYETTLPIGTTRERFTRSLEKISGKIPGQDFFVVFSPERVFTGRVFRDLRRYPKIVGGIDENSANIGVQFYRKIIEFDEGEVFSREIDVWKVSSCEAAEMVKLIETTYRDVNIALANQFAMNAVQHRLDIDEIISAANSQPYAKIHTPGISVGGHCIPVYPEFYLFNDVNASLVREARRINQTMPAYFVEKLESLLGSLSRKRVLILGLTYREGVKEIAFSGALELVKLLSAKGSKVTVHDPFFSNSQLEDMGLQGYVVNEEFDAVMLHTAHGEYINFDFKSVKGLQVIIDGRGLYKGVDFPAPITYFSF